MRPLPTSSTHLHATPSSSSPHPLARTPSLPLAHRRVIVTAPRLYAASLIPRLVTEGARPVWVPGVATEALLGAEAAALTTALADLSPYAAITFTSRAGIAAVLDVVPAPALATASPDLWALGADGGALTDAGAPHVRLPPQASTRSLAATLAAAYPPGARILCPVPVVGGGLTEPPIVPRFLEALREGGLVAERVGAYSTLPGTPPGSASMEAAALAAGSIDAIVFSSTAESQGLALALGGRDVITAAASCGVVLAAHGPYTAAGVAAVLGVSADVLVVSRDFSSFAGVVDALAGEFAAG